MTASPPPRSNKKPLLIGCGMAVVLALLCAGGGLYFGWQGVRLFQAGIAQAAGRDAVAAGWQAPPADAPPAVFAPPTVGAYQLQASDAAARFPALGITRDGYHATYSNGTGTTTFDVRVYRADAAAVDATLDEIQRRIDDGDRFASKAWSRLPHSFSFSIAPPPLHGVLVHSGGWLVFISSHDTDALDPFLRDYLATVAERKPSAPPAEAL